jgi:hypothetical protein
MSETLTKVIVNCATGEQEILQLTEQEIIEREAHIALVEAREAQLKTAADARAAAKASGIAKLLALGLTEEEANALVK